MSTSVFDLSKCKAYQFNELKNSFCRRISGGIGDVKNSVRSCHWEDDVGVIIYNSLVDLANKTISAAKACESKVSIMHVESDIDSMLDDYGVILGVTNVL